MIGDRKLGKIYTIQDVNELIRDLKLIQKPRELGDRLNIKRKRIDHDSYLTSLWRTIWDTSEGRDPTIVFIEQKINLAFELVMDYIPKYGLNHKVNAGTPARNVQLKRQLDNDYIHRLLNNISLCVWGIESLRDKTYLGDDEAQTRFEDILSSISIKLNACQMILSSVPEPENPVSD